MVVVVELGKKVVVGQKYICVCSYVVGSVGIFHNRVKRTIITYYIYEVTFLYVLGFCVDIIGGVMVLSSGIKAVSLMGLTKKNSR